MREYDPVIGRWLIPDIERQYFSPYLALGNNPINRTDPDGGMDGDPTDPKIDKRGVYYELDEVVVTAPKMSQLEARHFDRGQRGNILSFGSFWNINPNNSHFYKTQWAKDFDTFAGAGANAISISLIAPVAGLIAGQTIIATSSAYSAAVPTLETFTVNINYGSTAAYVWLNGKLVSGAGSVSLGLGKFGYDLIKSRPVILFKARHGWSRGMLENAEKSVRNINILPSRGRPFIPLDSPFGPGFGAIYNLYKTTPDN